MKAAKTAPQPKKSNRGGPRAGSGRPRTRHLDQTISNKLISKLESLGEDVLPQAIFDLVHGCTVVNITAKGEERIYQQPPNAQMVMYVTDRLLGKMPTPIELPPPPERREDGFSTLILGDSAIRELAQHLFAAMGARNAGGLGSVREPIDVDTVAAPDVDQRRATEDR